MQIAEGYAMYDRNGSLIHTTVSETERAAKVNWLISRAGIMVYNSATDEQIADAFRRYAANTGDTLHKIDIIPGDRVTDKGLQ